MKVVIIGARAAGLKTACRLKRLLPDSSITVLEEGQHIFYAACGLPYFLSGDVEDFQKLSTTPYNVQRTPEYFARAKGVQVLTGVRVERIDIANKNVACIEVTSKKAVGFPYDKLIITTGATPVIPKIPGVDSAGVFTFTRPQDAIALQKALSQNELEKVAIIGAGYLGCQLCESFRALWGVDVSLFEAEDQVLSKMLDPETARIVELELARQGVRLHLKTGISAIHRTNEKLQISATDGVNHSDFDRIILAAGVIPRVDLAAQAGLKIGETGGIIVNERMQTSDPDIYAAGDCVQSLHVVSGKPCYLPLGSIANRMGRVAANTIAGKEDTFAPVCEASCLKVFDVNIAGVGLTAKEAQKAGFDIGESWGFFTDKPDYYPEFENVSVKMVFDRKSQRILGVQAVSKGEAIRRVDAASTMIRAKMTLRQVSDFEPAYAPPFADILDPLHFLSYAGISIIEENVNAFSPLDLQKRAFNSIVLDVREHFEIEKMPFATPCKKLVAIPFPELRGRLHEIPETEPIIVVCPRGSRSNEAARILLQNGFIDVQYMGGGLGFLQA